MNDRSAPTPVMSRIAVNLFGLLLVLLPRRMRVQHGAQMRADFSDMVATTDAKGTGGVLVRSTLDLIASMPREWLAERRGRSGLPPRPRNERLPMGERVQIIISEFGQAARALAKRPGFTLVATLTLALGIGANVAIFAVVNAILIRPLPYPESERIVSVRHHAPGLNLEEIGNSAGTLSLYRDHARSYSALAGAVNGQRNLTGAGDAARVEVERVTATFFDVVGVDPVMGRRFTEADAEDGAEPVAVLTHAGWSHYFGRTPEILSTSIELNGEKTRVIGVMPEDFSFRDAELAVMLPMKIDMREGFGSFGTEGLARLRDGVTMAAARTESASLQAKIPELFPDVTAKFLADAQWAVSVETLRERMVGDAARMLWIVLGTVGFLLLVACASVANLFLVRAESRQREVGVRLALGATRARIAAAFLYESTLLGLAGGLWGLVMGSWAVRLLVAMGPEQLPRLEEVSIDGSVLGFAAAVSVLAALFFGVLPLARHTVGPVANPASHARGSTAGRDRQRVRKTLIVAQIALAIILLTGSGLMLQSFQRLRAVDPGIRPQGVLTVGISLGESLERSRAAAQYQQMVDAVGAIAGVDVAGVTNSLPLDPTGYNGSSYYIESKPRDEDVLPPMVMYASVSEGFMEAMGTRLVTGRNLERADHEHDRKVIVINEHFARTMFEGDAIGERIRFADDSTWHEIVGVVADIRTFGIREDIREMAYLPMTVSVAGARIGLMTLAVRTEGDPMSIVPAVREAIRRVAPNTPLISVRTMQDVVDESLAETSFTMTILVIASVVALLLGAIGLYGVIGYVVSQRTREIGLRVALGAVPGQVRRMVMNQGLSLAVAGTVIGLAGAAALTRLLDSLLYGVDSTDPVTFVVVPLTLLAVSAIATYVPARRASTVAPLEALRAE